MTPSKSQRIKAADDEAHKLMAEIRPLVNEVEDDAAVKDVVDHIAGVIDHHERKVETERKLRGIVDSKPKEAASS